jgi:Cytochrome P460
MITFRVRALAIALSALLIGTMALAAETAQDSASPVFGVQLPEGYRNWQVISVAHEAGNNNDIRVILGNQVAMEAFRKGLRPFPDGTIIARLAWKYVPSARNNAIFGQDQSFVAGDPTNVQISIKDSKKYPTTAGWGYGQYENGKADPSEPLINTCFGCHNRLSKAEDLVFTHYAP